MVELVNFSGVEKLTGLDINHFSLWLPAVPQPLDHLDELLGDLITFVVRYRLRTEVCRRYRGGGGNQIPSGAAFADVIERAYQPGEIVRLGPRARAAADKTEMAGVYRHRSQGGEGLYPRHESRVVFYDALNIVSQEHEVELATLGRFSYLDKGGDVLAAFCRTRMTPPRDMIAGADGKNTKMHLSLIHSSNHADDIEKRVSR